GFQLLQISDCGFGETDDGPGHSLLLQSESRFCLSEGELSAGFHIGKPLDHCSHKGPLLFSRLIVGHRVHDGDASSAAGQQHGSARVRRVLDHSARIDLEIRQRDHVLGELSTHNRSLWLSLEWSYISTCLKGL